MNAAKTNAHRSGFRSWRHVTHTACDCASSRPRFALEGDAAGDRGKDYAQARRRRRRRMRKAAAV